MGFDHASDTTPLLNSKAKGNKSDVMKEAPRQSCCTRVSRFLSLVTVEPAMFLMAMGFGTELVFKTNMLVDKTCAVQLHYASDVCRDLDSGNYKAQQNTVQRLTANYNLYCQLVELVPGAVVMMLLGTWSDTRSRRLPLLLPLLGSTFKSFAMCCNVYWWSLSPAFVPLSFIPFGVTGGMMAYFMGAYAYVSEVSGHKGRTTRVSVMALTMYLAIPLGNILGAFLFSLGGYIAVFTMILVGNIIALFYIMIRIRNTEARSLSTAMGGDKKATVLSQLRRSWATVMRRRATGVRENILGHICCLFLLMISIASANFLVLYTRNKFQWSETQFIFWLLCECLANIIGSCVLIPLLSIRYRIDDTILAFIGGVSKVFSGILIGTATSAWILYLALVVSAAGSMSLSCSRGALSKLVPPEELGAVFSVVGLLESLAPVITSPLYTVVYNKTLDIFPGAVFLISSSAVLVTCCIYTWLASSFPITPNRTLKENLSS